MKYKMLCERIHQEWRADKDHFSDFSPDFDSTYLPEPYFPIKSGDNELVVLNNNPGKVKREQSHAYIHSKFSAHTRYADVADWLSEIYINGKPKINANAASRNIKVLEVADALGATGVESLETFFLHSKNFNKTKYLRKYLNHPIVVKYNEALHEYLRNKAVLIVTAIGTQSSINARNVIKNDWLKFQADIAGMNLKAADFKPLTKKERKVTSCILREGNKIMVCMMGSNNIPVKTSEILRNWNM